MYLQRRAVLLGAGVLAGIAGTQFMGTTPAQAEPTASEADLALLRRTFELARDARKSGNTPFGALVADAGGNVIAERGNESAPPDGDPTRHAEVVATAAAWHVLGDAGMNQATLYQCRTLCDVRGRVVLDGDRQDRLWDERTLVARIDRRQSGESDVRVAVPRGPRAWTASDHRHRSAAGS